MKLTQMTRAFYFFIFTLVVILGCTKMEIALPQNDLSFEAKKLMLSSTVHRNQEYISSFGIINFSESKVITLMISSDDTATLIITPIIKNGVVLATIESIKIPNNRLPHNDDYAINLVDYRKYDFKTKTGNIEMVDINYDLFNHSSVYVVNNLIKKWDSKGLSKNLEEKYDNPNLKQSSKQVENSSQLLGSTGGIYSLCDSNIDQNISFSECYKCATDAISADGFSTFVCDIPILGWASCWVSKSATCVYLSSAY